MSGDDMHPGFARQVTAADIERPCPEEPRGCGAPAGELCVTHLPWRRAEKMHDRTHVFRGAGPVTGNLPVILPLYGGPERRAHREEDIRASERQQVEMRLIIWSNTLGEDDPRRCGVLAAVETIRGQR